jgi:hypothetical protein
MNAGALDRAIVDSDFKKEMRTSAQFLRFLKEQPQIFRLRLAGKPAKLRSG